jgi:hypothetical protein
MRVFWNEEQERLRTFWRLLIHTLLFVVLGGCLGFTLTLVGGVGVGLVQNVEGAEDIAALANSVVSSLIFRALSGAVSLVVVFASTFIAGRFLDHRPFKDFGFRFDRRWWWDLAFGLALGAALMLGIFAVEYALGWVTVEETFASPAGLSFAFTIIAAFLSYLFVGIYEEVLSRGYHLTNLAEGFVLPAWGYRGAVVAAWVLSSSIFGLLHAANPNATVVSTFNLVIAGLFLGLGYVLTGELAIPIGLHITWNFFQGNVFGFPVSGGSSSTSFIAIEQGGPKVWTGGAFGPEAGLIGLVAIAVGCLLTVAWVRYLREGVALRREIAEYEAPEERVPSPPPATAEGDFA